MKTLSYFFIYVLLFLAFFYKAKRNDSCSLKKSMDTLNKNRWFFFLLIIIGHCISEIKIVPLILLPISKTSQICVAYFFLMSGYGLSYKSINTKSYLKNFISKKIGKIIIVTLTCVTFSNILYFIFCNLFKLDFTFIKINWYIYEMLFMYIIFYICYYLFSKKQLRLLIIGILLILQCSLCLHLHMPRVYYISEFSFILGIIISEYLEKLNKLLSKNKIVIALLVALIPLISYLTLLSQQNTFADLIFHNTIAIIILLGFIIIFYYFENKSPLERINKISFESYLNQFVFLKILSHIFKILNIQINIIYFILVLFFDLLFSYYINKLNNRIVVKIKRGEK